MFQYRSDKPQVKRYVVSSIANSVYQVSYELPNDLRLRISGSKEILGKSQIRVQSRAQATLQKLNFGNSSQKTRTGRHYPCLVQPYWISPPYGKFDPKDQNCQFKLKFGCYTKLHKQSSMVLLTFSLLDWKAPFWANLVQKDKIISLSSNLVPRPIRIWRIQWYHSLS